MTEHLTTEPDFRLEYIVGHEAWYADTNREISPDPYLSVVKAHVGGGCAWEFQVVDRSQTIGRPAIQVKIFDETFSAFAELAPLFAALAAEQPDTIDGAREILDRLGFVDATDRETPAAYAR